jgi:hypothetical protein
MRIFCSGRPLTLFSRRQKLDRPAPNSRRFFDTMGIAPHHDHKIAFSFQRCWLLNSLISDRQCTYFSIVRALTISNFCFCCSCGGSYKKTLFSERSSAMRTMKTSSCLLCMPFHNTAMALCQRQGDCHHALFLPCTSPSYAPLLGRAGRR